MLKAVGKFLKRTELLSGDRDTELLRSFARELDEEKSIIFVFKLIHRGNTEYYDAFSRFYAKNRGLTPQEEIFLEEIISRCGIDRYQQERMKIDVMYRHAENKLVVDEYRDVLITWRYEGHPPCLGTRATEPAQDPEYKEQYPGSPV